VVFVLNEDAVRGMLNYVADKIIENKPLLTELDSATGDGDHGIGMAGGMQKVKDVMSVTQNTGNVYALFEKAGKALMSMGGASGVLFATLYMAGAKGAATKAELTPEDMALMMEKSLAAIKERGKAQAGDKTMVDALEPAVEAMKKNTGKGMLLMLRAAAEAAEQGAENTKKYQAKYGRAKSLMERAIGFQDAGAVSVWIIFRSMGEFVEHYTNTLAPAGK
jgi:dihydroxyacetone kinase phosphoprotein-dependent L subunit